jgi:CubicO group peptidase (beta-lactamase class C family)
MYFVQRIIISWLAVMFISLCAMLSAFAAQEPWPNNIPPQAGDPRLVTILQSAHNTHHIPAMGAAVVRSNGLIAMGVVGWRKLGDATPVTVDDQWHLGSNTKSMTATLAARLIERGVLHWDSTVTNSFSFVPMTWQGVTLDHFLVHRSGAVANIDWHLQLNRMVAVRTITAIPPTAKPGEAMLYSNAGYMMAGAMLEKATGRSWEQLMVDELWKPLGITAGGFGGMGKVGLIDQPWGHKPEGIVVGNGPAADNAAVLGPAGTVHMSLADWSRYVADQLNGARAQPALLTADSYRHLHQPWPGDTYARGWIVVPRGWAKGNALTHTGSNTMHYAVVWMAPQIDLAILVCCNQGDANAACDEVASGLIKIFVK